MVEPKNMAVAHDDHVRPSQQTVRKISLILP